MTASRTLFERDLERDLEDPQFRAAYARETKKIAMIDLVINTLDDARRAQGLSKAALARAIGTNPSSIRRLFSAHGNPTLATLTDIAAVLGMTITLTPAALDQPPRLDLTWLATQTGATGQISPQALATFMDYLPTPAAERQTLLDIAPPRTDNAETDNLLAGLAETIADETGFPAPDWCARIAPLEEPLPLDGTPRMIARQSATALPRLLARGITMPRSSLFRDRPAMDAR